jgi:CheY-like chemotaxis protein
MAAGCALGDDADRSVILETEPGLDPAPDLSRAVVLVVDDSRFERQFVGHIIEQDPGLRAVCVGDGREALNRIAEDPPAVILTDFLMPGMDGLELVEAVRPRHPEIPVILMTAHGSEETAIRALRAGAASYVPKHALAHELHDVLRQVLHVATSRSRRRQLVLCMKRWEADFVLENDPQWQRPLVDLLQEQFQNMQIGDSSACTQVGIALVEALANALYHGNLELSSDLRQEDEAIFYGLANRRREVAPFQERRIHVHARFDEDGALYRIRDEGPGFDTSALDHPIDPNDLTRIGGRGLLLIRSFMDDVQHNPAGNELTMVKRPTASA